MKIKNDHRYAFRAGNFEGIPAEVLAELKKQEKPAAKEVKPKEVKPIEAK